MIRARIGPEGVEITGHAGFAPAGSDIVCAAVSMLALTLAEAVRQTPGSGAQAALRPGRCMIRLRPEGAACRDVQVLLRAFAAGMRLLQAQYPAHVRLDMQEKGEGR